MVIRATAEAPSARWLGPIMEIGVGALADGQLDAEQPGGRPDGQGDDDGDEDHSRSCVLTSA
jgi:hypothetical protein